ncbi:hypothetical protein DdX_19237 [Ditylenchus destructor]|uniref:Uncharacterized protein n=1 Tax=Ditylenchus destructor TaxID=166010 RepID=A0AAD4MIU3_9BILA|nr:hypothetical protein DdX_19237 [Ditylenchus destructor]
MIRQSLHLGETRRLVPVSPTTFASTGRYGFRKSGKSWIWGVVRGGTRNALKNSAKFVSFLALICLTHSNGVFANPNVLALNSQCRYEKQGWT